MIRVIGFKTEYKLDKATDWVQIAPADSSFDKTRTWHRVRELTPPPAVDEVARNSLSYKVMVARWDVIEPAYRAWKEGQDVPETGTPLAAWAALSPEQVAHLRLRGIKTVEDVRDMSESLFPHIPFPNVRQLPALAAKFLDGRDKAAADADNAALRDRIAALEAALSERAEAEEAPKRSPGRPRKADAEVAA